MQNQLRRAEIVDSLIARGEVSNLVYGQIDQDFIYNRITLMCRISITKSQFSRGVITVTLPMTEEAFRDFKIRKLLEDRIELMMKSTVKQVLLENPVLTKPKGKFPA